MDVLQRARDLYAAGRMHDALEAAQAACDRAPRDPHAWSLLGRVSRHIGLPAASDDAFRRACALDDGLPLPYRVSPEAFRVLVDEVTAALPEDVRRRQAASQVAVQAIPSAEQVRSGVDPDALTAREGPQRMLVLFQVNHENRSAGEAALRALVERSLTHG
jgi:hypothetical protein